MSFISEAEKITEANFLFVLLDAIFLVSPGLLVVFHFNRELFLGLDSIKLILLSIASTLPLVCWNIILLTYLIYKGKIEADERKEVFFTFSFSLAATSFIIYFLLFISYLFPLSLRTSLFTLLGIEVVLTITLLVINWRAARKIKNSKEQPIDYSPLYP